MIDCPCGFGKNIKEDQEVCPVCGTDLTPLHRLKALPKTYYSQGIQLTEQGNADQAIEKLIASISLDPVSVDPYKKLAGIYTQKGLYGEAINYYAKALGIEPENEEIKKAKEETEAIKYQLEKERIGATKKAALSKKLFIAVFVAAFLIGLMIIPLSKNIFLNEKQPVLNEKRPPKNYFALADEIKKKIFSYHSFTNLDIDVIYTDKGFSISGEVPTKVHKNLIAEVARNAAVNERVDMQNLSIEPPAPVHAGESDFFYTVRSGDNLCLIAYRFYGDSRWWNKIYEANRDTISNPQEVFSGQVLSIPVKWE